jgi:transposase
MPRIYVKSWNVRSGRLYVRGELQVAISIDFYYKHMARARVNKGRLYAGVDVNIDRINLVIVDDDGRLRDTYTFWFEEASRKGCSRRRARSIVGMRVHEMLEYAYHHGVKTLFLENPEVLGKLKLLWIRIGDRGHENYNYKRSIFRSSVIEMIALKAPLYSINVKYVDPKGTTSSREHNEIMMKHRLDRHTASAYLIALKGLEQP